MKGIENINDRKCKEVRTQQQNREPSGQQLMEKQNLRNGRHLTIFMLEITHKYVSASPLQLLCGGGTLLLTI